MRRHTVVLAVLLAAVPLALAGGGASAASKKAAPAFTLYTTPSHNVVEPSIGVSPKTGDALFSAAENTFKVHWDDRVKPAKATFTDVTQLLTGVSTLDPIVATDRHTGRTFVSQLALGCSVADYTDDGGKTFKPSQGCGLGTAEDHQTLGAGPLPKGLRGPLGTEAAYYCAQNGLDSVCGASRDGGVTFGAGVPTFNQNPANNCGALSGHVKVAPDGTAYVPNKDCGGTPTKDRLTDGLFEGGGPAVAVSTDNGVQYTVRRVPNATTQVEDDNTIDVSRTGRLWMAWQNGANRSPSLGALTSTADVAWSDNQGRTWSKTSDLSTPLGLNNIHYASVVTGDADRAAVSFYGTTSKGDDQREKFRGDWHYYVALTYDAGRTWTTQDLTPTDPIKRNCVDNQGLKPGASNAMDPDNPICTERDLFDFMDIGADGQGRVIGIFTDACTTKCRKDPNVGQDDKLGVIARQSAGRGLLAAFDNPKPATVTSGRTTHRGSSSATASGTSVGSGPGAGSGTAGRSASVGARLATTGAPYGLAVVALGLLAGGLLLRRARRSD